MEDSPVIEGKLLKGRPVADMISKEVIARRKGLESKGRKVRIATIQVGQDPASTYYLHSQRRQAEKHGIEHTHIHLEESAGEDEIIAAVESANRDPSITGIMVLSPLPKGVDLLTVRKRIDPLKDIEGVHPLNLGLLLYDKAELAPATALAAVLMLEYANVDLLGKDVVIVGRSTTVGKPLALLLLYKTRSATVTLVHTGTARKGRLEEHIMRADIIIAAMGSPGAIKGKWIKEGAVVIDVGINQVGSKIVGDVEFEEAVERASIITPVPGGVGVVTTSVLMLNAVKAAELQEKD